MTPEHLERPFISKVKSILSQKYFQGGFIVLLIASGVFFRGSYQIAPFLEDSSDTLRLDRYGKQVIHPGANQLLYSGYNELPSPLLTLLTQLEDKRFFYHPGIDPGAIISTLWTRKQGGASTIDQQLIKLREQNFSQRKRTTKIRENLLALILQTKLSKEEILTAYVNQTHFPRGVLGYRQACLSFFDQECSNLSLGHLVTLYARAKYPHDKDLNSYILNLLHHLDHSNYTSDDITQIIDTWHNPTSTQERAYREVVDGENMEVLSGNTIQTHFDPGLQQFVKESIEKFTPYLSKYEAQDTCVIVMDKDKVVAADIARSQFAPSATINTCLIPRQIGSVGKPRLYLLALQELGWTSETLLHDEKTLYSGDNGFYIPRNATLQTHGEVSLADALGSSLNIPAVETLSQVGISSYRSFLRQLNGISKGKTKRNESAEEYGLSLALGTKAITPLEVTQMRSIRAQCSTKQGFSEEKNIVYRMKELCHRYTKELGEIAQILATNSYRRYTFPINNRLDIPGVYAKTGTSRKFVDGWVCGGDGRYTVCVRVGNASGAPMKDSGYTTAGILWHAVMERIVSGN